MLMNRQPEVLLGILLDAAAANRTALRSFNHYLAAAAAAIARPLIYRFRKTLPLLLKQLVCCCCTCSICPQTTAAVVPFHTFRLLDLLRAAVQKISHHDSIFSLFQFRYAEQIIKRYSKSLTTYGGKKMLSKKGPISYQGELDRWNNTIFFAQLIQLFMFLLAFPRPFSNHTQSGSSWGQLQQPPGGRESFASLDSATPTSGVQPPRSHWSAAAAWPTTGSHRSLKQFLVWLQLDKLQLPPADLLLLRLHHPQGEQEAAAGDPRGSQEEIWDQTEACQSEAVAPGTARADASVRPVGDHHLHRESGDQWLAQDGGEDAQSQQDGALRSEQVPRIPTKANSQWALWNMLYKT